MTSVSGAPRQDPEPATADHQFDPTTFVAPEALFDDAAAEQRWRARVRAPRWSVPRSAGAMPSRSVYRSSVSGTAEIYCWDRDADTHRQVTDRPHGTLEAGITPDGDEIWWFADTDGDEHGHWVREPFHEGEEAPRPALPGIPDGYDCGLALGKRVVLVGVAGQAGVTVWISREGSQPEVLYEHAEDALVRMLSADETLVALNHAEHGDNRNPGVRVLRTADGSTAGYRLDPGTQLLPTGFSPRPGDTRLLLSHERRGRTGVLIWDVAADREDEVEVPLPGDVEARWSGDAASLVLIHNHAGRSSLHLYDLTDHTLRDLEVPQGFIEDAAVRPDGAIEYLWSSGTDPWAVRTVLPATAQDHQLLPPGAGAAPRSVPLEEAWVDGPGGPIHVLYSRPTEGVGPFPTIFRLHGGPHAADVDAFNAMRAAWVDAGFAVVHVNFRGSSGYGSEWRNAITGRPGLTELEDVEAARRWCVASGIARADQCVAEGYSWGGMLSLLAAGIHPNEWAVAIGGLPVCDCVTTYEDEMPSLQTMDRALFGGTPDEVPQAYQKASPINYVAQVRAPVLILAGRNDPRCPIRQVEAYVHALRQAGQQPCVLRYDFGHGPQSAELVEAFVLAAVSFTRSALGR